MQKLEKIKLRSLFLFYGGLTGAATLWIGIANRPVRLFGIKGVVLSLLIGFLIVTLSLVLTDQSEWGKRLEKRFSELLVPLPFITIFYIALLSSIGEELFFRGAVQ